VRKDEEAITAADDNDLCLAVVGHGAPALSIYMFGKVRPKAIARMIRNAVPPSAMVPISKSDVAFS
jgi:hypothetical protein